MSKHYTCLFRRSSSNYLDKAKNDGKKVFITGHSLGGHLAMIAYLQIQNRGYEYLVGKVETFNAVGLQKKDADAIKKVSKIRQWYTCCDIANWGSETTIGGLGKLYFPAVERPMKTIETNPDGSQHIHSTELGKASWWDWITLSISYWSYQYYELVSVGIKAHKIENFDYCEITIDPKAVNPETGLSEEIIPYDILEAIKELGLEIHGGINPPQIGGSYLISPVIRVKSNFTDYSSNFADIYMTFSEQNNTNLTVKVDYTQIGNQATGLGAFIRGEGNKFTVYVPVLWTSTSGYTCDLLEVYSGEIEEGGIRNWQQVLIMKDDHGDPANEWIENGQGRLFKDGNGFSERITQSKSAPVLRSKSSTGVSIISSTQNK